MLYVGNTNILHMIYLGLRATKVPTKGTSVKPGTYHAGAWSLEGVYEP